jgi:hypothetical protein
MSTAALRGNDASIWSSRQQAGDERLGLDAGVLQLHIASGVAERAFGWPAVPSRSRPEARRRAVARLRLGVQPLKKSLKIHAVTFGILAYRLVRILQIEPPGLRLEKWPVLEENVARERGYRRRTSLTFAVASILRPTSCVPWLFAWEQRLTEIGRDLSSRFASHPDGS